MTAAQALDRSTKLGEQDGVSAALHRGYPVRQGRFLDGPQTGKPGPMQQTVDCRPRSFVVGQFVVAMKPARLAEIRRGVPVAVQGAFELLGIR